MRKLLMNIVIDNYGCLDFVDNGRR